MLPRNLTAITATAAALLFSLAVPLPAYAQQQTAAATCSADDFAAAVDRSGASLRTFNGEVLPKIQDKIRQLGAKRGWNEADSEEKALSALRDARTEKLDADAEDLITKIDMLGRPPENAPLDCSKLTELEAAGLELLGVMKAKSSYTLEKLDAAIAGGAAGDKKVAAGQTPAASPAPAAPRATETPAATTAPTAEQGAPPKPVAKSKAQNWAAQTTPQTPHALDTLRVGPSVPTMEPSAGLAMLEPLPPEEQGYDIDEIREITRGFFGTISTELGSVIEYAFSSAGRPSGYVLGTEGGGAFLAGVRYGSGTLYMRSGGSSKIHWHGPSIGTDFGAAGSRTMFLIYRVHQPDDLYRHFTGIDGSAYLIGGVGITFLKGGQVMMAPIRTGLGLRLGASIGYIRFTPRPTWNPF
ncbi:DUF1134 domain-containing protein [Hyphomicrobium sulfonivorans]|uniref:DUF1134 domain-containing protein n=1 Tax=Hyphomicrobium sulfonivorans TaxID=121290 RepID=UPI001570C1B0|nr:DUF1134 domain-containing protein [Hyphomicrobium sulfonivorans]MBI1650170.1 DUF1134 domain-containing protein [Hyphomicrobium sulfonivorans]NSL73086.1 DUF1134 domain-containing protein [Hyphomicrobium sulfonivorans]